MLSTQTMDVCGPSHSVYIAFVLNRIVFSSQLEIVMHLHLRIILHRIHSIHNNKFTGEFNNHTMTLGRKSEEVCGRERPLIITRKEYKQIMNVLNWVLKETHPYELVKP